MRASALVSGGFVVLPLLVAAGFVLASDWADRRLGAPANVRRRRAVMLTACALAWLLLTALAAGSGVLRRFDAFPPPFAGLVIAVVALGVGMAFSPLGTRLVSGLPLWFLVGFQVFRFPLELVMHAAAVEGTMPVQMSYSGQNGDILTGISAGVLGWRLSRRPVARWIVTLWNVVGFALLVNIVTVAILSTPLFRWFGDDRLNTFVTPAVRLAARRPRHRRADRPPPRLAKAQGGATRTRRRGAILTRFSERK